MERELLLEIGTEEIPASWLPGLTAQIGQALEARLKEARLTIDEPVQAYSTPRRLIAHAGRIGERQADLEELVMGPPVSAAFKDGVLTPAGAGFAKKQGVAGDQIERITTPKGEYIGVRKHQRGKTASDVLPDVLAGVLRSLSFPKQMRWDATLADGKGELPFGRPIRWILYLYGGRVVPFIIGRTAAARDSRVLDISAGASTYGHRFLTTSGRPGRAIKVKHFDDFRKRLAENFVVLERSERHDRIARELDAAARRRGGRVARALVGHGVLEEVPDLVEYPVVVSGTFADEFLTLPEEVLTTTMIHHQHFFPVNTDHGQLMPVFLAVLNMQPEQPEVIAHNMERVLTARLRDARFFFDADREAPLASYTERLSTVLFHKKLGSYREKAARVEQLARWICGDVLGRPDLADAAAEAGRLCKADLGTSMVRELTELQGTMGGIYAREDGRPEEVWKAIYFHYLPVGVEATAPPTREQLGKAAITWAAVALADKLDTVVGMFAVGEKPTGSRDPYGLRRAAQGIVKILVDSETLLGFRCDETLWNLIEETAKAWPNSLVTNEQKNPIKLFFNERLRHLMQERGLDYEDIQFAIGHYDCIEQNSLSGLFGRAKAFKEERRSPELLAVAGCFKRANNIVDIERHSKVTTEADWRVGVELLTEPAANALRQAMDRSGPAIRIALAAHDYRRAVSEIAALRPQIDTFFANVRVNVEDLFVKEAKLSLLAEFRDRLLEFGDLSVVAPSSSQREED